MITHSLLCCSLTSKSETGNSDCVLQMDDYCLKEGKRCIMWDDEESGFFLVRISHLSVIHVLHRGRSQAEASCERPVHSSVI